jgi:hypothetical protein
MARRLWTPSNIKYAPSLVHSITLPRCPHCKEPARVYRNVRATGSGRLIWDRTRRLQPPRVMEMNFEPYSEVLRCEMCHKIRPDLFPDGQEVKGASE